MNSSTLNNAAFNGDFVATNSGNASLGLGNIIAQGSLLGDTLSTNTIGGNLTHPARSLFTNATAATNQTTGAVTITGGVGIGGSLYAGNIFSNGVLVQPSTYTAGTNISIASNVVSVLNNPTFSGQLLVTNSTNSISTTTGAVVIGPGGLGVAQDVWIGGNLAVDTIGVQANQAITLTAPAIFPGLSSVAAPTSGNCVYTDTTSGLLSSINSTGAITVYNPQTTAGDLTVYDGTSTKSVRLPIGTNNQVLQVNTSIAQKVNWTTLYQNGMTSSNTDTYMFYCNVYDLMGGQTITSGGTYLDIPLSGVNRLDTNYSQARTTEIKIATTGVYIVSYGVTATSTTLSTFIASVWTSTGTYAEVTASRSQACTDASTISASTITGVSNAGANVSQTTGGTFLLNITAANTLIKLRITETTTTNTGKTVAQSFLNLTKLVAVSPVVDTSVYYNVYASTPLTLSTTYTLMPFNTTTIAGTGYSNAGGLITVPTSGMYIFSTKITCLNTGAHGINTSNNTQAVLQVRVNGTATSTFNVYCPSANVSTANTGSVQLILNVSAGQTVGVYAKVNATNGTTTTTYGGFDTMSLALLQTSSTAQTQFSFANINNSAATTLLNTVYTAITMSTALINTNTTLFTVPSSTAFQVNGSGTFLVSYSIDGSGSTAQLSQVYRLAYSTNGGTTWSIVPGSCKFMCGVNSNLANINTAHFSIALFLNAGTQLQLQGLSTNLNSPYGSSTVSSCNLVVCDLEQTLTPLVPALVFGSNVNTFSSTATFSTTAQINTAVYSCSTGFVSAGTYAFHYYYELYVAGASSLVNITMDATSIVNNNDFISTATTINTITGNVPMSGLLNLVLSQGIHTFVVSIASPSPTNTVIIKNINFLLYRVI